MVDESAVPGGRRLRADARRNRELVVAAARTAFAEDGLAISFDEIARRVGVGVGTVYRHFPTREALFEAVLLDRVRQFVADAVALADADDPGRAFLGFVTAVIDQLALNQALCEALEASAGVGFETAPTVERDFLDAVGTLLRRAQQAGAIRSDLDVVDVRDILVACATAQRRASRRGGTSRLVAVVCEGMTSAEDARS
ncbi:TetR/AcrR family transcriptional regulator [Streptoalloteichus hindustanus]|uniref:Transcriptional regulator, TetR family n=1 Tax=Streptoalloteichus hindustanus TaxID=2017 RepID=A0A1M5CKZ7_STRHI|nr:TetR/AcrR family transcriptional regulator [Streptoalloteichus hindustanus]SHF55380.1 transcriptional regulator, TetR family [Streptoalloteichus hindustanus]